MIGTIAVAAALSLGCQAGQVDAGTAQGYRAILGKHVENGRVAYKAIAKSDMEKLNAYVTALGKAKLPSNKNARIGFYIDAYNAFVIKSVIDNGVPRSVLDVKGFFKSQKHTLAGKSITLDQLEKQELNPYAKDPRTHFVLVCAAVGCPIIEGKPFAGSDTNKRMDAATRRYLTSPTGSQISDGSMKLSMIFKWYEGDFGGNRGVIDFVRKHLPKDRAAKVAGSPKVEYIDYNWTLNQR